MTATGPVAIPHQTVLVWRGEIHEIRPAAVGLSDGVARQIDGRGKWLIPGLADMHVHTYDPSALALFVSMGVTTVRMMWGVPQVVGIRRAIERGEPMTAPTIFTAGSILDGKPPLWPGSTGLETVAEATAAVETQHREGYDFVKPYAKLSPDVYAAIVKEAAARKMPVMGHVPFAVGVRSALNAGQKTIEHLDGYAQAVLRDDSPLQKETEFKNRLPMLLSADPAKIRDIVALTKKAGTWNCPTLVVMENIGKLDHPDTTRPELRFVPKSSVASWDPANDFRFKDWTAADFQGARDTNVARHALVKQLSDAGAGILAGTDVGNPWLVPGFSLHDELALLVEAKLTPHEALRAATRSAAELFNSNFGTIEQHKRADLVLLDADPLADIKNTRKIAGVMLRGRWMPASELTTIREQIAAVYAGTRSRYEGVAPLADKATFAARYLGDGMQSGEQRIAFVNGKIVGDTRLDSDVPMKWDIDPGPDGTGTLIRVEFENNLIALSRHGNEARVVHSFGPITHNVKDKIDADEILAADPIAADALLYRRLGGLAVDATVTVKLAKLELTPAASISHLALVITRRADATKTVAGKSIPVRMFDVMFGFAKAELALDADGWPVEASGFRRVD